MIKDIYDIQVDIIKKRIKNIYLKVLPPDGRIKISVPFNTPDYFIEQFITTRLKWIREQQEKIKHHPTNYIYQYKNGEELYFFGKKYLLNVQENEKNYVFLKNNSIILYCNHESGVTQRETIINKWYKEKLQEEINKYLPKWERITGLYSSGCQIRNMKTRWGSCSIKTKKIRLNLQLAKMPVQCLEYVILHELTHLAVSNHGSQFKKELDRFMPEWRNIKNLLNEYYNN